MYEEAELSLPAKAHTLFTLLLQLYPESYRRRFGEEIHFAFQDVYHEELIKNGRVGLRFWLLQISDIAKSVVEQHVALLHKIGMKKYLQKTLHINKFNIVGGVLLLPILVMMFVDLIARIAQRDLIHYNRPVYAFMSHTPLYWYPVLFIWVALFPLLAVGINLIPVIVNAKKYHWDIKKLRFFKENLITFVILAFGLFFILLIKFHDFAPCMIHGILKEGLGQLFQLVSVCNLKY